MKIKLLLIIFSLGFFLNIKAQSPSQIVKYFKNKDVNNIVKNCVFDFDLNVGSIYDDSTIKSKEDLKKILIVFFNESYFADMLKGKLIVNNLKQITYESRQFNEKGELESESAISFFFKKVGKKYKLYSIVLAG